MSMPIGGVVVVSVLLGLGLWLPGEQDFAQADAETVRLHPGAFPGVAPSVRTDLKARGCTVPQHFVRTGRPVNVIRGRFMSGAAEDIAVLCSRSRRSAILVYRGGVPPVAAELAAHPDATYLQVVDAARGVGFSRALFTATPDHIRRHAAHGRGAAPPVDHDGIEDAFLEKASVIWYWSDGRWLELSGAD